MRTPRVGLRPAVAGQQPNVRRNPLEDDSFPAWSPDGSWIVFSRYGLLHTVARDGADSSATAQQPGDRRLPGLARLTPTSSAPLTTTQLRRFPSDSATGGTDFGWLTKAITPTSSS
jgi:hypothetical protein